MREAESVDRFYKNDEQDLIWWVDNSDLKGVWEFSYDMMTIFNMFADPPWKLSEKQKKVFDEENPYWADFFIDRTKD